MEMVLKTYRDECKLNDDGEESNEPKNKRQRLSRK